MLALLLGPAGCTLLPPAPVAAPGSVSTGPCRDLAGALDRAIDAAHARDHQAAPVDGFPFLRINRLLAALRPPRADDAAFTQWLELLRGLDLEARQAEIANLPPWLKTLPDGELLDHYRGCSAHMRDAILSSEQRRQELLANATAPDAYHTSWRALGLYPLTSLVVARRIERYQDDIHRAFRTPLEELPRHGRLTRYGPPAATAIPADEISGILRASRDNPLAIPLPDAPALQRLFEVHAPVLEIDTADDNDRIGSPYWNGGETPRIDTQRPVVYQLVSHTRLDGRILLQLNYVVWFPQRPVTGAFDIYAGHLDGIDWRVTLDENGQPLMYDSMHNCGCYHQFFPTPRLRLKQRAAAAESEPPLAPQTVPDLARDQRLVIRIASRTHFIERIHPEQTTAHEIDYTFADYNTLRSLTAEGGQRRSLFGDKGIVPGTQRAERWILWPMGVPSPGAMRQWGQHAIAFVGRRHFDDADLVERFFEVASTQTE